MGQNKLDKAFRNKLNQREITPSENAWDRLDAMLAVAEVKKSKRSYGWLYIAASFIGFLFIGIVFFSQTEEMIDIRKNPVVIENNLRKPAEKGNAATEETIPEVPQPETIAAITHRIRRDNVRSNHHQSNQNPNPEIIINSASNNPGLIATNNINQKTEQQTTPAKVDELLAVVTKTPAGNTKPSVKVNANNLLSQVDGEVNLSFRERLLRTAHRNYQEVAEAVSTRNIQE